MDSRRSACSLLLRGGDSLTYSSLVGFQHRSMRNRSWRMLSVAERGLYRCALWVAKARGKITNTRLMVQTLRVALKLLEGFQNRIAKAGKARAMKMFEEYAKPGGLFEWAPRMREWLHSPSFVWYIGVMEVNG